MNGLSLFSGIGGIDLALAPWVRPVAYCEIDPYAQAVLLSRMADGSLPCAPIWPDVRTLPWRELPPVEIVYGGFPCQDLSLAGRGAGLGGKRSGLFFEMLRIVAEIRPAFVFLENVPALTARGLDQVTAELSALRFDCRWGVLSANDMGAPHLRERIWILAHANGLGLGLGLGDEPESQSRRKRKTQSRNDGPQEPVAHAPGLRRREGEPVSGQAEREVLAHADWRGEALAHAQGTRLPRRRGGAAR